MDILVKEEEEQMEEEGKSGGSKNEQKVGKAHWPCGYGQKCKKTPTKIAKQQQNNIGL
jgi:hypothetical protein